MFLRTKPNTTNDTKHAWKPIGVCGSDCHATCYKGIAEQRPCDDEADDNRGKDTESGAKQTRDGRLRKLRSAAKDQWGKGITYHRDTVGCGHNFPRQ